MKKLLQFAFALTAASSAFAAQPLLSPAELQAQAKAPQLRIIDIRDPKAYAEGHIPGARLIPLGTIDETIKDKLPDKKKPLIVYCRSGVRSKKAAMKLVELGYTDVRDMGGILDWPYEIEK